MHCCHASEKESLFLNVLGDKKQTFPIIAKQQL